MKKILIFVLSFCNIALPVTYGSFTENHPVEFDNDEACTKLCSERGKDYVKNSVNATLVVTSGVIDKKRESLYRLVKMPLNQSSCTCTVTIQYKENKFQKTNFKLKN